jgi:hypothetical protein
MTTARHKRFARLLFCAAIGSDGEQSSIMRQLH